MYESFYKLSERPFLVVPDPTYIYWSEDHVLAFTMLRYGLISRAPVIVVTGEIGAGKTTLVRKLLNETPSDLTVGLVSNMQAGRGALLHWIMMALGEPIGDDPYVGLFHRFQEFAVNAYARNQRVLLIIDEAQNLDVETLEELRMLSNINADKDEILQIMLVGQPQLRDLLVRPELQQFAQRVSVDFHLSALNCQEVAAYIQHRMTIAGASWRIFPNETCELIFEVTRGVPRLINILCDLALVYGYSAGDRVVSPDLLREFLESSQKRQLFQQFDFPNAGMPRVRRIQ